MNERGQAQLIFALLLVVIALAIFGYAIWQGGSVAQSVEREKTEQERERTAQERERTNQITAEYRGMLMLTAAQTARTGAFLTMMFPYLIWGTVVVVGAVAGLFVATRVPLRKIEGEVRVATLTPMPTYTFTHPQAGEEEQC